MSEWSDSNTYRKEHRALYERLNEGLKGERKTHQREKQKQKTVDYFVRALTTALSQAVISPPWESLDWVSVYVLWFLSNMNSCKTKHQRRKSDSSLLHIIDHVSLIWSLIPCRFVRNVSVIISLLFSDRSCFHSMRWWITAVSFAFRFFKNDDFSW